ncbi:MAG: S8 family serine peptidase, partial [Eubacterium sp.]|nr:S8 family serine peptidase [Eubacterium sp.]
MKKSLKCLSVILVMLITLFSFSITALAQTTEQDGLQVNLTTDKQSYSLNEDIEITVSVTNTNDFTVEDVSIEALLPDNFELKDSKQNTSTKAVDLKAGEQTSLSVIAVVKGQEEKSTEPSTKPDDTTKPTESTTENKNNQNINSSGQTTTNNNDNNKSDKADKNTNSKNNKNGTSPYTGADYTFMGIFLVLFLASVSTLFYCLIKRFQKTTKIVSSILCAVIAVTSVIGFSTFNVFAQENKSAITVSEQIKVDNIDYTITANVSYKVNDNINLTIDNKQETVVNFNQKLSGKFSLASNVISVTYTIATEIDDYEITDSGNAFINGNTFSADIQLKPQINKITVTATTESGKTESKTVKITYDSGKIYELDESHIAYDSETNTHYVDNIILIFFDEGVSDDRKNEIVSSINGKVVGSINGVNQWQVEVGTNDTNGLKEICNGLMNLQEIVYADFDRITNVSNDIVANDPYKNADGGDWYLDAINAYSAWNYNGRFNNINIGIVDNGFDIGHEDLRGKIKFPQQWLEDTNSKEYHGTHVAGIIGAIAGNEKGITGLLWNSNLYCVDWEPIKKQEWNTQNRLLSALSYTVEAGSKVINYSLGQTAVMPNGVTDWSIDYINEIGRKSSVYM